MESIIALIKGMGIFHLQWGASGDDRCKPTVAVALPSRANLNLCCYCQLVSADYCPISPEAGLAMTALENLLHLGSPEQIAVIASQLGVPPDPALIKTALNSAPISMINQLEALSVDYGL